MTQKTKNLIIKDLIIKEFTFIIIICAISIIVISLLLSGCTAKKDETAETSEKSKQLGEGEAQKSPASTPAQEQTTQEAANGSLVNTTPSADKTIGKAKVSLQLAEFKDTLNLYSIKKPASWTSEVKDGKYMYVHSPAGTDGNSEALIWSAVMAGKYSEATALDMANYLVGQIKKDYADFKREGIYITKDRTLAEIIATYKKAGIQKKAVFTVVTKDKSTLLTAYAADSDEFDSYEPVLREVLASYKLIVPENWREQVKTGRIPSVQLIDWVDPTASRSMTARIPKGWLVQIVPDCTTHAIRIWDPNNPANQIFRYQELLFYESYTSREATRADKLNRKQNCPNVAHYFGMTVEQCVAAVDVLLSYADNPVVHSSPGLFVTQALPESYHLASVQQAASWSPHLDNVRIVSDWRTDSAVESLYSAYGWQTANIVAEFTESEKYPAIGVFTVATGPPGIDGLWPGSVVAYSTDNTDPSKFADLSLVLIESIGSFQYTPEFVSACKKAMDFRSEVIQKNYQTIQETNDIIKDKYLYTAEAESRISEQRSDAILGIERVYNPDTGEVYQVYNGFYNDYSTHTDMFNMQNLRPLQANEWGLVPLDGVLHIT